MKTLHLLDPALMRYQKASKVTMNPVHHVGQKAPIPRSILRTMFGMATPTVVRSAWLCSSNITSAMSFASTSGSHRRHVMFASKLLVGRRTELNLSELPLSPMLRLGGH